MSRLSSAGSTEIVNEWIGEAREQAAALTQICFESSLSSMRDLAERLGIGLEMVYRPDLPNFDAAFCPGSDPFIVLNTARSKLRQEFSIAHEIAHFVLSHRMDIARYNAKQEFQAQVFAFILIDSLTDPNVFFEIFDENPDLLIPHAYASMPDWVSCGTEHESCVLEYIEELIDIFKENEK